jgi:glycogen synthase
LDVLIDGENAMVLESSSLKEIKRGLENVEEVMKQNVIWRERNQKIIQEKFQWEGNIKQYYILYMNIFR